MSHQITSEDNWLVQCLFLSAFGALLFYGITTGWIAQQLGVQSVSANQPARVVAVVDDASAYGQKDAYAKTNTTADAGVPRIMLSGVTANQEVSGTIYVTVLPKEFQSIDEITVEIAGATISPKESGSATYAIDTTQYPNGRLDLVVDVVGTFADEAVVLQDTMQIVVRNTDAKKAEVVTTEERAKTEVPTYKTEVMQEFGRIVLTDALRVRVSPAGDVIGGQQSGASGLVRKDSAVKQGDYTWIYVTFDSGVSGYVAQQYTKSNKLEALEGVATKVETASPVALEQILKQMQELQTLVLALQARLAELEAAE